MAGLVVAALLVTSNASGQEVPTVTDPSKTIHGERSPGAPRELDVFAFLIGKWDGRGRTSFRTGRWPSPCLDRPLHPGWDGDRRRGARTLSRRQALSGNHLPPVRPEPEDLGHRVSERLRVVPETAGAHGTGSVTVSGRTVTVTSESPGIVVREHYVVPDADNWVYRLDSSTTVDGAGTRGPSSSPSAARSRRASYGNAKATNSAACC